MIELNLKISDIDYDALAELMLPMLISQLGSSGVPGFLGGILSNPQSSAASMAKAFWNRLPREKKDELAVKFLNANRYKVKELLEKAALQNGVALTVYDAEARL